MDAEAVEIHPTAPLGGGTGPQGLWATVTVRRGSSPLARAEAGGCEFSAWRAALACIAGEARPHTTHTLHRISRFRTQQPGNPRTGMPLVLRLASSCIDSAAMCG